jgi:hypothetical protein
MKGWNRGFMTRDSDGIVAALRSPAVSSVASCYLGKLKTRNVSTCLTIELGTADVM